MGDKGSGWDVHLGAVMLRPRQLRRRSLNHCNFESAAWEPLGYVWWAPRALKEAVGEQPLQLTRNSCTVLSHVEGLSTAALGADGCVMLKQPSQKRCAFMNARLR